jgi:hypothetical protein
MKPTYPTDEELNWQNYLEMLKEDKPKPKRERKHLYFKKSCTKCGETYRPATKWETLCKKCWDKRMKHARKHPSPTNPPKRTQLPYGERFSKSEALVSGKKNLNKIKALEKHETKL